jgi:hypothetical protein
MFSPHGDGADAASGRVDDDGLISVSQGRIANLAISIPTPTLQAISDHSTSMCSACGYGRHSCIGTRPEAGHIDGFCSITKSRIAKLANLVGTPALDTAIADRTREVGTRGHGRSHRMLRPHGK